ncbi:putative alginate lyase [Vibrio halioticoli NBRC 102217]|uniref:Putative alginate lyase n=1 Tax=Vibrio halioticoli NBRC 102217 TaxID=1219072 RepID=V5F359_9VIBR|nr:polysaccharide lyase family 7 protein [Vibrio halioticoli]GAD89594.1 putative alginate lyase [Vibrio halioticoli NBRC 102217]
MNKTLLVLALAAIISGCGSSDDSSQPPAVDPNPPGDVDPTPPDSDDGDDNDDNDNDDGNGGDNGGDNDNGSGDEGDDDSSEDHIAPYDLTKFQPILSNSDLQMSDPEGAESNKESIIKDGNFHGYFDDYFYAEQSSQNLVFKMSNYLMRSEVRELENFDVDAEGIKRTLYAEVSLPNIEQAMSNSSSSRDQVTFLQIHNKGTASDGTGYIPHPLLRVVYETERDGNYGHYWAVIKNNAVDCKGDAAIPDDARCDDAYDHIDLGEANTDQFTEFQLAIQSSRLSIRVNGIEKADLDIDYWAHLLSYFKAGVYNQFENGESEAHFKSLKVIEQQVDTDTETTYQWNIDEWKITIPASKDDWYGEGGSSAAELFPARCGYSDRDELANDEDIYHADQDMTYFSVENGRMHFRADMGYGSTTENSSYIRSELRELYMSDEDTTCSSSNEDSSWYLDDDRTGASTHTLKALLRVEEHPDLSQPKVILGQIHGWKISQALVKLLWEGDNRPVRVILNDDYETNNSSCGHCEPFSVDLGTYKTGEEWGYTIRANQEGIYLATYDADGGNLKSHTIPWGEEYVDNDGDKVVLSADWASPDIAFYFKAGIYPQFSPNYSGEIFDVSFSYLDIDHY